jgi:glycine/D-amino acid oxidase-like deaminating enzyme
VDPVVRRYRSRSLWLDTLDEQVEPRDPLPGDRRCDVVVVGGGFTGPWAAYYLRQVAPELDVVVVERELVGFGASGRNGGWASAGMAGSAWVYARRSGPDAVRRAEAATNAAVDEIGRMVAAERIDCGFAKGGTFVAATTGPQRDRLHAWYATATRRGLLDAEQRLLGPAEAAALLRMPPPAAGFFTPHCARLDPARLARGLAVAAERRGAVIHEGTTALRVEPGRVVTDRGTVHARVVLRATESYTAGLPGQGRSYLPLTSLMIGTEPLPAAVWDELGWPPGLTVRDRRHLFFYAQRTPDDRLAIGGRGAPYSLRRPFDEANETNAAVRDRLVRTMHEHFPATVGARVTHHWGGTLAVPRDWCMAVGYDPATGLGAAGGYSGHGVVAANLAGRTLADLVAGRHTELTRLPWVGHRSRRWEPEPLRWLASRLVVQVTGGADRHEDRTGRRARRTALVAPFLPPG